MPTTTSTLLRNAKVYDGTGSPGFLADVRIVGEYISDVVPPGTLGSGSVEIDADGLALTPGFVDIHSHSDGALAHPDAAELLEPFVLQGITTQVIGNCGLGLAPAPARYRDELAAFMALVLPAGVVPAWDSFAGYVDHLDACDLPVNAAPLAAHGALRCAVLGAQPGPARGRDLEIMTRQLTEALAAGAFGLSAGLIYPPGSWSDTNELTELCRRVAAADGLFACHLRGSSELGREAEAEFLDIGRHTGVRLQHSHHEAFGHDYWPQARETMRMEDEARAEGLDVASDVVPYHAVNTTLLAVLPPWTMADGIAGLEQFLREPGFHARLEHEIETRVPEWPPWENGWAHNLVRAGGWDNITLLHARSTAYDAWIGRNLSEVARDAGRTPLDCALDVLVASGGDVMARYHAISGAPGDDEVLRELLTHPHHAIGVDVILKGQAAAHPGGFGAMPRVLGHYGRDAGWLEPAQAIRKITAQPADRLRLDRRGRIKPGWFADLVLVDQASVAEVGSYDRPDRPPRGIEHVFINGRHTVAGGNLQAHGGGKLLRRAARTIANP